MQVEIDSRNSNIVFTGYQFGNYYRLDLDQDTWDNIQPKHELGESPLRFNWQTPIELSTHNQDILYFGSNKLHRSFDQGKHWEAISPDLTRGGKKGNVAYGTLTTFNESSLQFGLIYAGSDDGLIHGTQNGGVSWDLLSSDLPKDLWVSRITASMHQKNRVYAALNGYRNDDFTPYLYLSENGGQQWKAIANNLPEAPVNDIIEDPVKENILYVATDRGVYVSFNKGDTWEAFANGLTSAAVHDLVIQPEAKHLLVGTHGRSIYKASIAALQDRDSTLPLQLFVPKEIKHSDKWGTRRASWAEWNQPEFKFLVYSQSETPYTLRIISFDGEEVHEVKGQLDYGFATLEYKLRGRSKNTSSKKKKKGNPPAKDGNYYLTPGVYTIEIKTPAHITQGTFKLTKD